MKRRKRIALVAEKVFFYGHIEGEQHKAWLVDQTLKVLLGGKGYKAFVKDFEKDFERWNVGIPP